uniref:Fascin domain-containing protein n=1 Tax=Attheya septentrionalis TaxID=420275 RepID=A0A7S2UJ14_9STRA|mmetsp:Transcript_27642/g.50178  ORF Transcript_27642/g.50178 Transcript_27642/m.50178 type:complete len:542 (+) Transcript_27642:51-1676(+)
MRDERAAPTPTTMEGAKKVFPCIENPVRCYFSSERHDKRLSSSKDGRIISSDKRSVLEEFLILPQNIEDEGEGEGKQNNNLVMVQSVKHGLFLRSHGPGEDLVLGNVTGTISTTPSKEEATLWCLQKSSDSNGGLYLLSMDDNTNIGCDEQGNIYTSNTGIMGPSETWKIEFLTGELCFMMAYAVGKRLRCDVMGKLSMSDNCKGWEVWRFIEAGGGYVRISSWMHHTKYICSDPDGTVFTTTISSEHARNNWDKWKVLKNRKGHAGVVIQSAAHGRILCFGQKSIFTQEEEYDGVFGVWQLEAAHNQKYSLYSSSVDDSTYKAIGPFPYLTGNKRQTEEWRLDQVGDNLTFFSLAQEMYLGSSSNGGIHLSSEVTDSELWRMEESAKGGRFFHSVQYPRRLSWKDAGNKDGELCTVPIETECSQREMWRLQPCMPRAVSGKKIRTFAIGATTALATTIAMPFAVAGVIGLIGAEVGILADIVVVGLTSVEAAASIGIVGATAAIIFKESGDTLSMAADESTQEKSANDFAKRPFCAWRSW